MPENIGENNSNPEPTIVVPADLAPMMLLLDANFLLLEVLACADDKDFDRDAALTRARENQKKAWGAANQLGQMQQQAAQQKEGMRLLREHDRGVGPPQG